MRRNRTIEYYDKQGNFTLYHGRSDTTRSCHTISRCVSGMQKSISGNSPVRSQLRIAPFYRLADSSQWSKHRFSFACARLPFVSDVGRVWSEQGFGRIGWLGRVDDSDKTCQQSTVIIPVSNCFPSCRGHFTWVRRPFHSTILLRYVQLILPVTLLFLVSSVLCTGRFGSHATTSDHKQGTANHILSQNSSDFGFSLANNVLMMSSTDNSIHSNKLVLWNKVSISAHFICLNPSSLTIFCSFVSTVYNWQYLNILKWVWYN